MSFHASGRKAIDYYQYRLTGSRLQFRGPKPDLSGRYYAFLGGSETFGKFVDQPFVSLVERTLRTTCANLGYMNAGTDVFLGNRGIHDVTADALATVVQVMGAQNMSNRLYTVHPRRNDRFLKASSLLQNLYRDVDFTEFHFTKHMLTHLHSICPVRFDVVEDELRNAWSARMRLLLEELPGSKVLFWFADHPPSEANAKERGGIGRDPLFVSRDMLAAIQDRFDALVEVVPTAAILAEGTRGMRFEPMDQPAAAEMMGPAAHAAAADALVPVLRKFL